MLLPLTLAALAATAFPSPVLHRSSPSPAPSTESAAPSAPEKTRAAREDGDKFEVVELVTSDELKLKANYYPPKIRGGKAPAVILAHAAGEDRSQGNDVAEYLQRKGIGVLIPDLRGHGDSKAEGMDWKAMSEEEQERNWAFALRDIKAAASFLRERREIHSSNLSLMGIGSGAALAVRHAIDDENARSVILLGPGAQNLGFNLVSNVTDLEGLPALIVSPADERDNATRIAEAAHKANDFEYIDVSIVRSKGSKFLGDKKLGNEIYTWLKDQVMPKR